MSSSLIYFVVVVDAACSHYGPLNLCTKYLYSVHLVILQISLSFVTSCAPKDSRRSDAFSRTRLSALRCHCRPLIRYEAEGTKFASWQIVGLFFMNESASSSGEKKMLQLIYEATAS